MTRKMQLGDAGTLSCYRLGRGGVGREPTQLTLRQMMKQFPLGLERAAASV
jgi:hypothetical protein